MEKRKVELQSDRINNGLRQEPSHLWIRTADAKFSATA